MSEKKEKYLFFYLKTGGGHLAPAKAIADKIKKNYPKIEPLLIDGFAESPGFVRYIVEDGYRKLQANAKWIYEFLYLVGKTRLTAELNTFYLFFFTRKFIERTILNEKPAKIIILHFFLIKPVYNVIRKHKLSIPVTTLVTDPFTAHPMWFLQRKQNLVLFSERLREKVRRNFPEEKLNVFPFVLNEKYSHPLLEEKILSLKKEFGIEGKKVILILGGGDGIPKGAMIIKEIVEANLDAHLIVVCGKNKRLEKQAEAINKKYNASLKIYGYIEFVYELINISDIVISKCGASTMMEILLLQKVPIINSYIWEQEKGNIDFIIDNHLGIYEPSVYKLGALLSRLIDDERFYNSYKQKIAESNFKNGLDEVTEYLIKL